MEIILAEHAGYCFGVDRAVKSALETLNKFSKKTNIYSLGPLIHNTQVVDYFKELGLEVIDEIPNKGEGKIIIRAHGVPYEIQKKAENQGYEVVDTTCPYVKSVHNKVKKHRDEGYKIVIIGDPNHPEVIGINGWCNNEGIIINNVEDAKKLDMYEKICLVSQTTNTREKFETLSEIIKNKGEEVKIYNTICNATRLRQEACKKVAQKVDAMIVIGGLHSSNTNKLAEVAKNYCSNVYHIETINDLPLQELIKFNTIGITAGASTPDRIIKEVIDIMKNTNDNINDQEMLEAIENTFVNISRGDIVKGEVITVTEDEVMVNINYKSDGIVSKEELSNDHKIDPKELYKEGDKVEVYVLNLDDGEGNVLLSIKRVEIIKSWDKLEEIYENNELIECEVVEIVKGGVIGLVNGITGFIPASHLSTKFVKDLNIFKDKVFDVKIIDLDRRKNRLILSRKTVELEELKLKREKLWDSLEIDKVVEGEVKRLTNFGAFVDLGGVDGLIHISDLSWARINHPSDVLNVGDKVKVIVQDFSKEKNRISLGYKQQFPKPWDIFIKNRKVGDIIEGTVVNLLDFGAFVRLEEGVDGLVHVSQISHEHVHKPKDVLSIGEKVKVKIINIEEEDERISLSMKEVDDEELKNEAQLKNEEEPDVTIGDMLKDKE